MPGRHWRRDAAVALTAVVVAMAAGGPSVAAISPPDIVSGEPLRASPVGPDRPTEQRTLCAVTSWTGHHRRTTPSAAQSMLDLPAAWRFSRGKGQIVAIIDTGVTPHRRLPRLRAGGDYVSSGDGLDDCDRHGTLVAGIIGGAPSPDDAFAGVAPDATLISIRQSSAAYAAATPSPDGTDRVSGTGFGSVATLAAAVVRAVDLGATVINISEAACAPARTRRNDRRLGTAVKYAYDHDVVVVVAAGNLSPNSPCGHQNPLPAAADVDGWKSVVTVATPAWFVPYVLAVGAVDASTGEVADFSLHGPWVGVAAPGTDIVALDGRGDTTRLVDAHRGDTGSVPLAGTSFATPYVAGTVALVRARFPDLRAGQVMARMIATAHARGKGRDPRVGFGVIDPVAALTHSVDGATPEPDRPAAITAPPSPRPADPTARRIAVIGAAISLVLVAIVGCLVAPHKRIRRLEPDEY